MVVALARSARIGASAKLSTERRELVFNLTRRACLGLALAFGLSSAPVMAQQADPLPSWNDGAAKPAILDLVRATTTPGSPDFVPPADRLATFDQDGTLWVEHPIYSQVVFALDRVVALAPEHPEWKEKEPFKTVLSGDKEAMAKLSLRELEEIVFATHAGMTVEAFNTIAADWAAKATDHRWHKPYTELVYQPMQEVLACCAPTATAPTSSPAAARPSSAPMPRGSTASPRPR